MREIEKEYAVEIIHKNEWLTIRKRFHTFEEADEWAKFNYRGNKHYKIIEISNPL